MLRPDVAQRTTPERATLTVDGGVEGDNWLARGSRHTEDGSANPDQQVAVINARYLDLIAGERDRFGLAAVKSTNGPVGTPLRLRGLYVRVVVGGTVRVGDTISRVEVPAALGG